MNNSKIEKMIRIAHEYPFLRKAALSLLQKTAQETSWWVWIRLQKIVTKYDAGRKSVLVGRWEEGQWGGKKRFPNIESMLQYLGSKLGPLEDLKYARRPSSKKPNSLELLGERKYIYPGSVTNEKSHIVITKGGRVTKEEDEKLRKFFNKWHVTGVYNLAPAIETQITRRDPVGEYKDWGTDPARYQDTLTTRSMEMTPKEEMEKRIQEAIARFRSKQR